MHSALVRVAFGLALCSTLLAQGEVEPRLASAKGASVWLLQELATEAKMQVQGQEMLAKQITNRTVQLQVVDIDQEGNLLIEVKIVRVQGRAEMAAGQGDFDFDSAAAEENGAAHPSLRKMMLVGAGAKFRAKVGANGAVLEFGDGAATIVESAKEPGSLHRLDRAGLQQLVRGAFGLLPHKRTAGGARWEQEFDCTTGGTPLVAKGKCMLTQVEPERFEIEVQGTVALELGRIAKLDDVAADAELKRQLESSKLSESKFTSRQTMSRQDGFVLTGTEAIEFDVEIKDSMVGEMTGHIRWNTVWRRTTEAEAMPKPAATSEAGANKK
jgi:hypothetical protein